MHPQFIRLICLIRSLSLFIRAAAGILLFAATAEAAPDVSSLSPTRQVLSPGQSITLSVSATGTGTLAYQWSHNGLPLAGATGSNRALSSVHTQDAGYYYVDVTDGTGTTRSAAIFILVAPTSTQMRGWGSTEGLPILRDVVAVDLNATHYLALQRD